MPERLGTVFLVAVLVALVLGRSIGTGGVAWLADVLVGLAIAVPIVLLATWLNRGADDA